MGRIEAALAQPGLEVEPVKTLTSRRTRLLGALIAPLALWCAVSPVSARAHRVRRKPCVVPRISGKRFTVARRDIKRAHCRVGRIVGPRTGVVKRTEPKAHARRKHGTKVRVIMVARHKAKTKQPATLGVAAPTSTPAPTPTPNPASVFTPTVVRASIDPNYTQDPTNNLDVTWTYSASTTSTLPTGVLTFHVTPVTTGLAPIGQCSINVGSATTGGACTIDLPSYGNYQTTVTYTGSSSTVAPSTQTETDTIEPLPIMHTYDWGTDSPTAGPTVSTILDGTTASVTVTDGNFEGATEIGVADNTGATCTAQVSGTTATCTMTDLVQPASYALGYPGGTTTISTQSVPPGGTQAVTTTWPAETVQVTQPSVLVQQALVVPCGGEMTADGWGSESNFGCTSVTGTLPWPATLSVPVGPGGADAVFLDAWAYGTLTSDPAPAGTVNFNVSPGVEGVNYIVDVSPCGPQCGYEELSFLTPGTYTVSASFTSADPNYADQSNGPSMTVAAAG